MGTIGNDLGNERTPREAFGLLPGLVVVLRTFAAPSAITGGKLPRGSSSDFDRRVDCLPCGMDPYSSCGGVGAFVGKAPSACPRLVS